MYTIKYSSSRQEVWRWYWRAWAKPNGLWLYHLIIGVSCPAKRGKGRSHPEGEDKTPEQRHWAMTWAQRLKRVFNI
jgi:hypothetical protein